MISTVALSRLAIQGLADRALVRMERARSALINAAVRMLPTNSGNNADKSSAARSLDISKFVSNVVYRGTLMQHAMNESRRLTVLVVENEPIARECIAATLEDAGFDVLAVAAAEDALALAFVDVEFDLLFTDIDLDGPMDGWELAADMREMIPGIPVIYTSGQAEEPAARVPESIFVPKPYDPVKVAALIGRQAALPRALPAPVPPANPAFAAAPLRQSA
ncbi:MAG: response regulator [Variibacter sp.]|nr:response regulator [Variibacter sp.]